ncbi:major facilitator superfamily protein [Burkholderia cenocepacia]|nr:major facilitator superfamily protein [Burkholderia cenocepacia]
MTNNTLAPCAPAGAAAAATPRSHRGWALVVLLVGAILPPLDYFIVNLALPAIRDGIGARQTELQLVVSAYACANAVVQITGGRLGDLYGRKRMFMIGMAGFVLASTLCGLAGNGTVLVGGRVLQGLFAAILAPQVLATIRSVFSPQEQVRVMGFYGFAFGLAAVIGQLGGGALISLHPFGLGWRAIFLVNLPIGILALLGSWRFIPENRPPRGQRIDVPGTVLMSLFLLMLVYPLTHGREAGWPLWMIACGVGALPMLGALLAVEARRLARGHDPLLDVRLFRNPVVALGLLLAFLFYTLSAFFLSYGIYLQGCLNSVAARVRVRDPAARARLPREPAADAAPRARFEAIACSRSASRCSRRASRSPPRSPATARRAPASTRASRRSASGKGSCCRRSCGSCSRKSMRPARGSRRGWSARCCRSARPSAPRRSAACSSRGSACIRPRSITCRDSGRRCSR